MKNWKIAWLMQYGDVGSNPAQAYQFKMTNINMSESWEGKYTSNFRITIKEKYGTKS